MIKAAVTGADSATASELIPLLLHHPDIEVVHLCAPAYAGKRVDSVFPGLTGDTDLTFADSPDTSHADVLLIADDAAAEIPDPEDPKLRIIDLTGTRTADDGFADGLCELNRKAMVRGATRVTLPSASTTLVATMLLPLAKHLMLNDKLHVTLTNIYGTDDTPSETARLLSALQTSLPESLDIDLGREGVHPSRRYALAEATLPCSIAEEEVDAMYDDFFDDHNFVYRVCRKPVPADVANTNKMLVHIGTDGNTLTVTAACDPHVKGCAGNAVHALDLLFGLHERTGLNLKPSR